MDQTLQTKDGSPENMGILGKQEQTGTRQAGRVRATSELRKKRSICQYMYSKQNTSHQEAGSSNFKEPAPGVANWQASILTKGA